VARISRKELKTDEFAQEVSKTYEFVQTHRDQLALAAVLVAVGLLAGLGGYLLVERRIANANDALGRALRTYHAPVLEGSVVSPEEQKSFTTAKEKYTEALKEFRAIADQYSRLKPGRIARYYAGLCLANLGNLADAEKEWGLVLGRDPEVAALARLALANAQARAGKKAEAEKLLRYLLEHPSRTVPRVEAQLGLADLLRTSNPAEAEKLYREVEKQNPDSSASFLARQGLEQLKARTSP